MRLFFSSLFLGFLTVVPLNIPRAFADSGEHRVEVVVPASLYLQWLSMMESMDSDFDDYPVQVVISEVHGNGMSGYYRVKSEMVVSAECIDNTTGILTRPNPTPTPHP